MDGEQRRQHIIQKLKTTGSPLSGTALGKTFGVSRQVIVQDIALLRTAYPGIISTHRGYILSGGKQARRIFKVMHDAGRIEEELNMIVDAGGRAIDVFVDHEIYGRLTAELKIASRRDVREFCLRVENKGVKLLTLITGGVHYHTVEADHEKILDVIEDELLQAGILIKKEQ